MLLANDMRLLQWAVGDIFITTNNINPQERFGGTWERFAKGKTLVGFDDSDTDFNTVNKTGGEKAHTLSLNEMPSHNHAVARSGSGTLYNGGFQYATSNIIPILQGAYATSNYKVGNSSIEGGSQPHNNLQPYITVYFWRKTA